MLTLPVLARIVTILLVIAPFIPVLAQTTTEQTGWLAWFNSYKLSPRWGVHLDVQARSADDWRYVRNLLIRPGLTYHFNARHNVTAGYALIQTYADDAVAGSKDLTEHRIWQQYIFAHKIKSLPLTHRFRLEQRFIERASDDLFSQRIRYFARLIVPLAKSGDGFSKGPFAALQNEIFLNLQNKSKLNNSVFDQNRGYGALGYRLSSKFDIEAGYLNQYVNGATQNTSNNVVQLALYTRF